MALGTPIARGSDARGYSSADLLSDLFTPAASALLLCSIETEETGATADSITGHDGGAAWAQIGTVQGFYNNGNGSLWGCLTGASPSSGQVTVSRTTSTAPMIATFVEITGVETGTGLSGAYTNLQEIGGYSATPTRTFSPAPSDMTICSLVCGYNQTATQEASFTEIISLDNNPNYITIGYDLDGADTTPSPTIAAAAPYGLHCIELIAAAAVGGSLIRLPSVMNRFHVRR